jgi:starch synthase
VNELVADPARAAAMGRAGRERAVREFDWSEIARQTSEVYAAAR